MFEFGEVKFEPVILRSETSSERAARQSGGHSADIIKGDVRWRGGRSAGWLGRSDFVRTACPILPATPATSAEEERKAPGWRI